MSIKTKIETITVSFKKLITCDGNISIIQINQFEQTISLNKEQALSLAKTIQSKFGE